MDAIWENWWPLLLLVGIYGVFAVCQHLDKKQYGSSSEEAHSGPRATIWGWIVLGAIGLMIVLAFASSILRFLSQDERNPASQPGASPVRETKELDAKAQGAAEFEREFFQKYPDLKPYRAVVKAVISRLQASGYYQAGSREGVMEAVASVAREELARQQEAPPATATKPDEISSLKGDADKGVSSRQFQLGWRYENGSGVEQDYAKAAAWYRKAAEQGDILAQNNLGVLLHAGRGVQQDDVEAYAMFCMAAEGGCTNAVDSQDSLAESLTPEQIADGHRRTIYYKALKSSH